MATYVAVPLKRTWEVDLVKPLGTFIASTYSDAGPEEYVTGLTEFQKLRNNMINKSVDKHESALDVLYRYYDQLEAIEGKIPITENQCRVSFKWRDAFDKESVFSGKRTLSVASGAYEKVCVLFNIGALQSQIAECQNHSSDDGLKSSAKLFQQASGVYAHLKDCVLSHVQNDPTPDLHPDTLAGLSSLMLAQGQDCFVHKAMQDKMKPQIVAKLAYQCSDLYADAMKLLQLDSIRGLWPKDWLPTVVSRQAAFHALAEYYQSLIHKEAKEFGEEIARLRHAKDLMAAAETRGGSSFTFQNQFKLITKSLESANKDNDFIYHAKIPELSSLAPIGKAAVAKTLPLSSPMSTNFRDLLDKVVPLAVHQAMSSFEARKAEILNREVGRLREATQLMNSVLASLNLPAAIEDLSGSRVPPSVLEKAIKVREMGGISQMVRMMNELPESLQRNKEILDEAEKMLNEEAESDRQLRDQFKERWTRTPSDKLTEPIRSEANKYRTIINNAIQADGIVKERFAQTRESIELLSKSDAEIEKALPSGSPAASLKGTPVIDELRQLLNQSDTLKAERDVMEKELKEATFDMSSTFMGALAKDGAVAEEHLSTSALDRVYGPLREQVSDSCHRQEALLGKVQEANSRFCQAKAQNQGAVSREEKLKQIATSYDSFMELKNNLDEGTRFYNDLTQLLVKFQSKVNDFCFARRTEKEELMKDLSSSIARQSSAAPPAAPSYQAPTTPGAGPPEPVPPPRPPPPSRPSRPAPVAPTAAAAPGYPASAPPPQVPGYGAAAQPGYPNPYSGGMPYPVYAPAGYVAPPMPQSFNPYGGYSYPPQQQPTGQAPYGGAPAYSGYPGYQQPWPR